MGGPGWTDQEARAQRATPAPARTTRHERAMVVVRVAKTLLVLGGVGLFLLQFAPPDSATTHDTLRIVFWSLGAVGTALFFAALYIDAGANDDTPKTPRPPPRGDDAKEVL